MKRNDVEKQDKDFWVKTGSFHLSCGKIWSLAPKIFVGRSRRFMPHVARGCFGWPSSLSSASDIGSRGSRLLVSGVFPSPLSRLSSLSRRLITSRSACSLGSPGRLFERQMPPFCSLAAFHVKVAFPVAHRMTQHPPPPCLPLNVSRAALVAASKTSSTPSPVKLEHSRYFRAPHAWAISAPSLGVVNFWLLFRISSMAAGSSLRSFFNPTRMTGTSGHCSRASSIHLCRTFSKLSGVSTLNPIRITCDLAYARGLSLS